MIQDELIDLIADQGISIALVKAGEGPYAIIKTDYYVVSLFGWNMCEFCTQTSAEKYKQTLKTRVKEDIRKIIASNI